MASLVEHRATPRLSSHSPPLTGFKNCPPKAVLLLLHSVNCGFLLLVCST